MKRILTLTLVFSFTVVAAAESPSASRLEQNVRALFAERCIQCHGGDKSEGGLRLDKQSSITGKLESGNQAVVPGKPNASELIKRVLSQDEDTRMPPKGKRLTAAQVKQLRAWITAGGRLQTHWSYRPLQQVSLPPVKRTRWIRNGIDRFVLARLEAARIQPSAAADRYTLIRRLYYDLLGLTPTIAAADAFVADKRPDAYDRLVDRLLSSPNFGERWGRHWLDKARYADSDGYEKDSPRGDAWRYRDWVIAAINADKPYNRFTVEQIAGDLLPRAGAMERLATAFHRQTLTNTEGGTDKEEFRVEAVFDRVATTGAIWLGLTIGCAQCHNHKYDQITQREFYQLFAFYNNGDEASSTVPGTAAQIADYKRNLARHNSAVKSLTAQIEQRRKKLVTAKNLPKTIAAVLKKKKRTKADNKALAGYLNKDAQFAKLTKQLAATNKKKPQPPTIKARVIVQRKKNPRMTRILQRGSFLRPGAPVTAGGISTLNPLNRRDPKSKGDRLDLAHWLVDAKNPLTPRVTINYMWQRFFGHGLVRTENDFGVRGELPTHPRLLDWLAHQLIRNNWSRKHMIRLIVTSATYRQNSTHRPEMKKVDPQNQLLYRQNRVRVEAEIVRDLNLSASGLLVHQLGGPSVFPPLPPDVAKLSYSNNFKWSTSKGGDRYRRGMYTFFKRTAPHPNLTAFDCPDSNKTCVERSLSNTPLQALTQLNNVVFFEASVALAKRVTGDSPKSKSPAQLDAQRIRRLFRLCVARPPSKLEADELTKLLQHSRSWYQGHPADVFALLGQKPTKKQTKPTKEATELAAWVATSRIVLNLDEFITKE